MSKVILLTLILLIMQNYSNADTVTKDCNNKSVADELLAERGCFDSLRRLIQDATTHDEFEAYRYWLNMGAIYGNHEFIIGYAEIFGTKSDLEQKISLLRINNILDKITSTSLKIKALDAKARIYQEKGNIDLAYKAFTESALLTSFHALSNLIDICSDRMQLKCSYIWATISLKFDKDINSESPYYDKLQAIVKAGKKVKRKKWDKLVKKIERLYKNNGDYRKLLSQILTDKAFLKTYP